MTTTEPQFANRRISTRRVTGVKVFAYDGAEIRKCVLKDISIDGAYIETQDFAQPSGTNLEIVLRIRRAGRSTNCRLPTQVIRVDKEGMAVMFGELDDELFDTLQDIVTPSKENQ